MEEWYHNPEMGIIGPAGVSGPAGIPCDDPEILAMINSEMEEIRKKLYPKKEKLPITMFERIMKFIMD
jgi:hypothetical protein